ncbi:MAG TPA: hypothetical protein VF807_11520 [Ktedonobacterales bacterium]
MTTVMAARFHQRPFATGLLLLASLGWLAAGCGVTTGTTGPTATATVMPSCASALPGSSAIDLQAHGFVYPIVYPAGTVSAAISTTASGPGRFTVFQFIACTPATTVSAAQSFYIAQLPALPHGWMTAALFPADGGLMTACTAPCFWNPKGGSSVYYLVFDQFTDRGAGVVTYRGRWAVFDMATLPTCGANFTFSNPAAQQQVFFVGSGATAFPVPPFSSITPDDASGGVRGYDICSPGTAASVMAFLNAEVPADGWTKVTTSNARCINQANCWTKGGQFWSWGAISDPTLWLISYRQ